MPCAQCTQVLFQGRPRGDAQSYLAGDLSGGYGFFFLPSSHWNRLTTLLARRLSANARASCSWAACVIAVAVVAVAVAAAVAYNRHRRHRRLVGIIVVASRAFILPGLRLTPQLARRPAQVSLLLSLLLWLLLLLRDRSVVLFIFRPRIVVVALFLSLSSHGILSSSK